MTSGLATASAADMRCGEVLVRPGDAESRVLEACGEPRSRATRMDGYTQLHVWSFGPPRMPTAWVVELENGKVKTIRPASG